MITISSKLSGTYNGAMLAKDMAEYDNIYVVDSLQASLSERLLVEYAVKLRDAGMGAKELVRKLEQDRERVILTGVPSTLLYLKMGGRISPVVAAVGGVIGIKPVLWLKDGVIESREYYGLYIKYYIHAGSQTIKAIEKNDGINIYEPGEKVTVGIHPVDVMSYDAAPDAR